MYKIDSIIDIVRQASGLMRTEGFKIEEKDGVANIVTSSDIAVQNFLMDKLGKLVPGSGFICEEKDIRDFSEEYVWIIDPIDGTQNYSRGIPDCCISVALARNMELVAGIVYSPGRGELYHAEKGKGAFCNGKPIHVSDRDFANSLFYTAASTYRKEWAGYCFDIIKDIYMECNDLRRNGSAAVELCLLARGYAELYFEMRLQPWDYAAASLILTEAGGYIASFDGAAPSLVRGSMVIAANRKSSLDRCLAKVHTHLDRLPY